jgi:hypothetical protein
MGLSMVLLRGPRSLSVLSLHVRAPLLVPAGPQLKVQRVVKEICHPSKPPWGSACSSREAPIHLRPQLMAWFEFSPRAGATPKAAAVGDDEVGLSGELVIVELAVILLPDPHHVACGGHLSTHIQFVTCQVPPCHVAHTGSRNEVIAGCRAAC